MPDLSLPIVGPPEPLYRVGRKPDPWQPLDWAFAGEDLTFGNRFDDSEGYFRVLYASSSPLCCYLEVLARFRRPLSGQVSQALAEIQHVSDDFVPPGVVPATWLKTRVLGSAVSEKKLFVPIYDSAWIGYLRNRLDAGNLRHGAGSTDIEFDLSLLMSQRRAVTQQIATIVYQLGYDGICYQSRHGAELFNWALFEPFGLAWTTTTNIKAVDPEFQEALHRMNLTLDRRL